MASEPVSFFSVESPYEVTNIRNRLLKRQAQLHGDVLLAKDWPDFQKRLGRLQGISEAIEEVNDVTKQKER